jgi:hypothetical protein
MSIAIIDAIRHRPDLRLSKRFAALELAHKADHTGTVRMSYAYLARKLNCCKRTAIRLITYLVEDARILRKLVVRLGHHHYDWNVYTFIIKFRATRAHPYSSDIGDKMSSTLPNPKSSESRTLSLRAQIHQLEKGLRHFPPPTAEGREACEEEIARLRALLEASRREGAP